MIIRVHVNAASHCACLNTTPYNLTH